MNFQIHRFGVGDFKSSPTCLFPYPAFGIELDGLFSNLEMEVAVATAIIGYSAENVTSLYLLTLLDDGRGKVAIHCDIGSMTDKDIPTACKLEDSCDYSIKDCTGSGSWTTYIVDALVVQLHILHAWHIIESKATSNYILPCDGHWETSLVLNKGASQSLVFCSIVWL